MNPISMMVSWVVDVCGEERTVTLAYGRAKG
jgi:hypothetical protein